MNRSTSRRALSPRALSPRALSPRALSPRALSAALTLTAALIVTLAAQVGGALSPSVGLISYAHGAPDGCQGLLQQSAGAWLSHQTDESFKQMVEGGIKAGIDQITQKKEENIGKLPLQETNEQITAQEVYIKIAESLHPVLSQSLMGTQCTPITKENVAYVLRTGHPQSQLQEKAGMLGVGSAGAVGAGLTTAAIGGYAALNAGFWATALAGGKIAVVTGALVPEPMTLAIIGAGGTVVAGGWYWWKKSEYKKSIRAYVSAVQSHVKNQVSLGAVARGLAQ